MDLLFLEDLLILKPFNFCFIGAPKNTKWFQIDIYWINNIIKI
jgi:hypothetical protein